MLSKKGAQTDVHLPSPLCVSEMEEISIYNALNFTLTPSDEWPWPDGCSKKSPCESLHARSSFSHTGAVTWLQLLWHFSIRFTNMQMHMLMQCNCQETFRYFTSVLQYLKNYWGWSEEVWASKCLCSIKSKSALNADRLTSVSAT